MLNERAEALLAAVNALCERDAYRLLDEEELLAQSRVSADRGELSAALSLLQEGRYIDVCYAEDGVYCLRVSCEGSIPPVPAIPPVPLPMTFPARGAGLPAPASPGSRRKKMPRQRTA